MAEVLGITVCFSPAPRAVYECALSMPEGSTVADALRQACLQLDWPSGWEASQWRTLTPGLWGHKATWETRLRAGDRVELYRPLRVDPKIARRERFNRQGARRAGLFARKRPGAASGF